MLIHRRLNLLYRFSFRWNLILTCNGFHNGYIFFVQTILDIVRYCFDKDRPINAMKTYIYTDIKIGINAIDTITKNLNCWKIFFYVNTEGLLGYTQLLSRSKNGNI